MKTVVFDHFDRNLIADLIHDRFFDVESISWDRDRQYLEFSYFKDDDLKAIGGKISFGHVIDLKLIDTEKIRYYDLNFINWNERENKIEIVTNIPLTFEITAGKFEMTVTMIDRSSGATSRHAWRSRAMKVNWKKLFFPDPTPESAFFALTLAIFGSWTALELFVLVEVPTLLTLLFHENILPVLSFLPTVFFLLIPLMFVIYAAIKVCRFWIDRMRARPGLLKWWHVFGAAVIVVAVVGVFLGVFAALIAGFVLTVWLIPLWTFRNHWLKVLLRGLCWTAPLLYLKVPELLPIAATEKLCDGGFDVKIIQLPPGELLLQTGGVILAAVLFLSGYWLTSQIYAAAEPPRRRIFSRRVGIVLGAFAAVYVFSVGMALHTHLGLERDMAALEKHFGAPPTAQMLKRRFYEGRDADAGFWKEARKQIVGFSETQAEKFGASAYYLPDGYEETTPEFFRDLEAAFAASPELKKLDTLFAALPPAPARDYTDSYSYDLSDLAVVRRMYRIEIWCLRFALSRGDFEGVKRALRRMENFREYLTHDDSTIAFRVMYQYEMNRLDAVERLLSDGRIDDAELLHQKEYLERCMRELPAQEKRAIFEHAAYAIGFYVLSFRNEFRIDGRKKYAPYSYRWLFPALWRLFERNHRIIVQFSAEDSFAESDRLPSPSNEFFIARCAESDVEGLGKRFRKLKFRWQLMRKLIDVELEKRRTGRYPTELNDLPVDPFSGKPARYTCGTFTIRETMWDGKDETYRLRTVRGVELRGTGPDGKYEADTEERKSDDVTTRIVFPEEKAQMPR